MKRNEYEEIEATAHIAMAGLLAGDAGWAENASHLADRAFDISEAFHAEKKKRLGDRLSWDD